MLAALLFFIPEGVLLACTGLGLLGIRQPSRRILLVGSLYGVCVPISRSLGLPFGFHTVLLLVIFILLARFLIETRLITAFAAWIFATFFITVGEQLVALPLLSTTGIPPEQVLSVANLPSFLLWGWISKVPLLVVAGLVVFKGLSILPSDTEEAITQSRT